MSMCVTRPFKRVCWKALILTLLFASDRCCASQSDFRATAEVLRSQQQTIVKLFGAGGGSLDSYGTGTCLRIDTIVMTVNPLPIVTVTHSRSLVNTR